MKKALFIFIAVVLLTALGVFLYIWFSTDTDSNLTVELTVPERVQVGVPFELTVQMANASNQELRDAQLTLSLPPDLVLVTTSTNKTIENKKLGTLATRSQKAEVFSAVAISGENTVKSVKAVVSYLPGSISSRFDQSDTADIVIVESGMFTDLKLPTKVLNGEEFQAELTYRNVSDKTFTNVEIRLQSPPGFVLRSSTVQQSSAGSWAIGTVEKGKEGKITVVGSVSGQDDSVFEFKMTARAGVGSKVYPISEKLASLSLSPSPLSLRIALSGESGSSGAVVAGDRLTYSLNYENDTDIALEDVIVTAQLAGEMFDTSSLSTNASFRSQDNTLTWNAAQVSGLSSIAPGQSGRVTFNIRVKDTQPITRLSSKNFILKVNARIESPTVPRFVSGSKITGLASIETKVRGQFTLDTDGYYRDSSGFTNTGLPPRVGKKTTYNVHWVIKNTSTDLSNVSMKAFLGQNVRFTGKVKATSSTLPIYNERTQEMSWNIDSIPATKGILSPPVEAIFQVEITPSIDQVNDYPELVQETIATATDTFTGEKLTYRAFPLTTTIPDDETVSSGDKVVRN